MLTLAACVFAWLEFGPVQLGGSASYVITDGTSMLPTFKAQGLVVTRSDSDYHRGEVVAYHNKELQAVVLHRIAGRDGSRYVMQGDNNDYPDHYQPTEADFVGQEWIYLPDAGRYLLWLRNPATFALIIGLMALVSFRPDSRRRRRRRHHAR